MLVRVEECRGVSRGVEGVERVERVERVSSVVKRRLRYRGVQGGRWMQLQPINIQQKLGSSCKAVSSLSCSLSCTLLM